MAELSPVRYLDEDDPRVHRRVDKSLRDKLKGLELTVLQGQLDLGDYRFCTGQIAGIKFALDEIARIIEEL